MSNPRSAEPARAGSASFLLNPAGPMDLFIQILANALAIGSIYALVAMSFEIAYEATGVVNFATGQLVIVGAFIGVSALSLSGTNFFAGYSMSLVGFAAVGVVFFAFVYMPLRDQPMITIIIATIATATVMQNAALLTWGPLPLSVPSPVGTGSFEFHGAVISTHAVFVVAVTAVLISAVYVVLYRSNVGAQLRALAQDTEAARLMGIRVTRMHLFTWILAAALAGVAGLLMAPMWFIDISLGDALAMKAFAAAIIGGFGSIPGAVIGGLLVGMTELLGAAYISSAYKDALVFGLMILFLLFRPQGIFGERVAERA